MNDNKLMNRAADNIRILAASMVEKAKSGHPGGAMGGADFINVLFSEFLIYDPERPAWEGRDRFFLDPGHMSPMLYSQLALTGKFTLDELKEFRQWGSPTPGHPERDVMRGIENTSGPLGQGHTFAVGAAIAAKFLKARFGEVMNQTIYAYISDGGVQEEISQGSGRIAGTLGLDNLIMFYDANDIQLSTETQAVTCENTAKKYESWGWKVICINGNDPDEIRRAGGPHPHHRPHRHGQGSPQGRRKLLRGRLCHSRCSARRRRIRQHRQELRRRSRKSVCHLPRSSRALRTPRRRAAQDCGRAPRSPSRMGRGQS